MLAKVNVAEVTIKKIKAINIIQIGICFFVHGNLDKSFHSLRSQFLRV